MKKKRILAMAMSTIIVATMIAGCGTTGSKDEVDGKVSITIGNWPNPEANPESYEIIEESKKMYMEKYPDVDFKTDEFERHTFQADKGEMCTIR